MSTRAKTIQVFLPDGDPQSVRIAEVTQRLVESGLLVPDGEVLRFDKDFAFNSPSAAAATVLGRTSNGWTAWRDSQQCTLKERTGRAR